MLDCDVVEYVLIDEMSEEEQAEDWHGEIHKPGNEDRVKAGIHCLLVCFRFQTVIHREQVLLEAVRHNDDSDAFDR